MRCSIVPSGKKETRVIMGMPVEIELPVADRSATDVAVHEAINATFAYFTDVDTRFSTYKKDSEISRINRGEIGMDTMSDEMCEVFAIAEKTKKETNGYFDIKRPDRKLDPSGIVKGWAIKNAAARIRAAGYENYFVNAGGDIAISGKNEKSEEWSVGIQNPFNTQEIVKVIYPRGKGVATSGSYIRGAHIYNPHKPEDELREVVSITVIGPDALEADCFATAAFAMGREGIAFIGNLDGFEGYMIDKNGIATMTSGFASYTTP